MSPETVTLSAKQADFDYKPRAELPDWSDFEEVPLGTRAIDDETGETVALYLPAPIPPVLAARLRTRLEKVTWDGVGANSNEFRLSGIKNAHQTFGYSEPVPLRRRYGCSRCRFTESYPELDADLEDVVQRMTAQFRREAPDDFDGHVDSVSEIAPRYRYADTPFTSGIINHLAALPIHKDAGNVSGAWSAMLGLRRGVEGGELILPAYRLRFPIADRSALYFDGARMAHAVTPFTADSVASPTGSRRTTVVFYAKRGIVKCLDDLDDEIARARAARTQSELNIAEALQEETE